MNLTRPRDRAIVVGVGLKSESMKELKESLGELSDLAETAGAEVIGSLFQTLESWNAATLIGSGKVDEIKSLAKDNGANMVIVDHQLSGVQERNLEKIIGVPVIDRTQLILDIFALRAQTHEGKLQVELAQLLDQGSRNVGAWLGSLSRQGGGIGTRGPGERALEIDRRVIRKKITRIRRELEDVRKHRLQHRVQRRRAKIPSFALIGYTNVGKSTLLNKLTKSNVYVEDQVFATLDPISRRIHLPDAPDSILTDTVGFIRKLPTKLIEAFKATLEESAEADILIHVIDLSHHEWKRQMEVVQDLLRDFTWDRKPILYVFNKVDQAPPERRFQISLSPRVFISAKTEEGLDNLRGELAKAIRNLYSELQLFFPHAEAHLIFDLSRDTQITRQEDGTQGVVCYAHMTPALLGKWSRFLVK